MKKIFLSILFFLISSTAHSADVTWGTAVEFAADDVSFVQMKKIATDKVVICYIDAGPGVCRVATISGTTPTFGTANTFNADATLDGRMNIGLAAVDTDQFAVVYLDDTDDAGYTRAANVSTTTISYGTESNWLINDIEGVISMDEIATDKFVVTYNDEGDSDTCYSAVGTIDATPDVTMGTPVQCDGDGTIDYDPREIGTAKLDTDKWVSCFLKRESAENDGYCVVGTTSGTTISYTVDPSLHDTSTTEMNLPCSPAQQGGTADRFVLAYYDFSTQISAKAATVSGGTITYGTEIDVADAADSQWGGCVFVSENWFLIAYDDNTNSVGSNKMCHVNWDDRSITCRAEEDFASVDTGESVMNHANRGIALISGFNQSNPKVAITYDEDADGDDGMLIIGDVTMRTRRVFSTN